MAKKFKIYTLGCKVNQYDSGKLASGLIKAGMAAVEKNADIAVINSCAVTKTAIVKSARMIKLAKKENPEAKIVLAGCWPKTEEIKNNKVGADSILKGTDVIKFLTKSKIKKNKNNNLSKQTEHSRYFIKIQDGCEQFCAYCIIPYTRGKLKSRGEREIIAEIKQAVEAGYSEIVLSGIHLGLYGRDRKDDNNLVKLLEKVVKINKLGRVRLSSIEITEVTDELIKLMAEFNKICKHLHIPLQAGSDKILKLMNRPYDTKYFKNKIEKIRRAVPDVAVTTDVIVGFPGETEKDFRDTEKFIKQIKFSRLHVFPFSAHEKTPAAKFPKQIDEKIKARRAKILRDLSVKLAENYKKKFKSKELEVALEQIKQDKIIGKTEYYFDIEFKKSQVINQEFTENKKLIGKIIKIKYI